MSVINQMLNGLDQRGAAVVSLEVRPVYAAHKRRTLKIFAAGVMLVVAVALAWPGLADRKPPQTMPLIETELTPIASRMSFELSSVALSGRQRPEKKSAAVLPAAALPATREGQVPAEPIAGFPVKQISPAQQADALFRKSVALLQQGRASEAMAGFEAALALDAGHDAARQALITMLLEGKKVSEAEQVLQDGLKHNPANSRFSMLLARLQVDHGELDQAIGTLDVALPHAGQQPDYQAFYAALLQRKSRHREAAEHYLIALKAQPNKGIWLMGYGISLQAQDKSAEAKDAYQHALDSKTLSPELQAFVQQKIKAL